MAGKRPHDDEESNDLTDLDFSKKQCLRNSNDDKLNDNISCLYGEVDMDDSKGEKSARKQHNYESDEESVEENDEVEDDELYSWLEEGVDTVKDDDILGATDDTQTEQEVPTERDKIILDEPGKDPFDVLPEGWVVVSHMSGMPVYLHRASRVCTMSRPYFLGAGSARRHDLPISAIPCLQYRRALEKEAALATGNNGDSSNVGEPCSGGPGVTEDVTQESTANNSTTQEQPALNPDPSSETFRKNGLVTISNAGECARSASLAPDELRQYCSSLFRFKTIRVVRFNSWKDRRAYHNKKRLNRPALPENTKLITCSVLKDNFGRQTKKQFVLNPSGKSIVCILHEYCQHALKMQPQYKYDEHENSIKPYSATVTIGETTYATGYASSKKLAKADAARLTVNILIPEMNNVDEDSKEDLTDLSFFDEVRIEDPRSVELCTKAGQPNPHQLLLECLKRNYGIHDNQIKTEYKMFKNQKHEFVMTVGKHQAKISCRNKREGKQLASQAILQLLHPHLTSLGAVLKMYGRAAMNVPKDMKQEEQAITELQQHKKTNKPNMAVLTKLKEEMIKLRDEKLSGKMATDNLQLHKSQIFDFSPSKTAIHS